MSFFKISRMQDVHVVCAILSLYTSTLHARPRSSTYPSRFHAMKEVGYVRFYPIHYVQQSVIKILIFFINLDKAQIRSMPLSMVARNAHLSTHSDHIGPISVSLGDSTKLVQPLSGKDRKMENAFRAARPFLQTHVSGLQVMILFVYFLQLKVKDLNAAPTCLHFVRLGRS